MATITFIGDLLCYPNMTEKFGPRYGELFKKATKLKNCDYLVANLETPIAGEEMRYTFERYCFNTPVGFIRAMKTAGVNMITLANNHCMDRGEEGIVKTLENCKNEGFETIGLYATERDRNALFIKEFDGVKVACINYTYGTNAFAHRRFLTRPYMVNLLQPEETKKGSIHLLETNEEIGARVEEIYCQKTDEYDFVKPYLDRLERDIKRAKEVADYVIMIMHCGGQYNLDVDPYTKYVAEQIKSFGADIIVGNHPHIVQECGNKDGFLTVYSMGNFMGSPVLEGKREIDITYNAVLHLNLSKRAGQVCVEKSFSLYKVVETDVELYAVDTFDLYAETQDEKLKEDILYFANRFAGEQKYDKVQEVYTL
ncbi:MAG: CapA family protein [Clostridia bacterium]|nr:CapA family protein [Clostridia bacterium]